MTFCVSHQKQLDNDAKNDANVANNLVTTNDMRDDAMRNHENGSAKSTESTNLGKHETWFIWNRMKWRGFSAPALLCVCVRIW